MYPAAGVIPTRPTTNPVAAPTAVALPVRARSRQTQVTSAAAAAVLVFVNASAARPLAARAEPALKPNQPNHRSPAPKSTSGTLCGTIGTRLKSLRDPSMRAATSAETPALMCTTVPPAKSSAPSFCSHPPADHSKRDHAHHQGVERVLGPHQPAVEERQPHGHHHHQRGRGQYPRGVACRHGGGVGQEGGGGGDHSSSPATAPACCALSSAARCT